MVKIKVKVKFRNRKVNRPFQFDTNSTYNKTVKIPLTHDTL